MSRELDEPAFPINGSIAANQYNGMGLRDYFATECVAAMVGTILRESDYTRAKELATLHKKKTVSEWFACEAYKQADAMLVARTL